MEKSLVEQMGASTPNAACGDYHLPDLSLPPQEKRPIGVWGRRRYDYLRKHKEPIYTSLFP